MYIIFCLHVYKSKLWYTYPKEYYSETKRNKIKYLDIEEIGDYEKVQWVKALVTKLAIQSPEPTL